MKNVTQTFIVHRSGSMAAGVFIAAVTPAAPPEIAEYLVYDVFNHIILSYCLCACARVRVCACVRVLES
jgi:hypothetical protein